MNKVTHRDSFLPTQLVSISVAAERLGVSQNTLRRWEAQDPPLITSIRTPGGQRRYDVAEIQRIIDGEAPAGGGSDE